MVKKFPVKISFGGNDDGEVASTFSTWPCPWDLPWYTIVEPPWLTGCENNQPTKLSFGYFRAKKMQQSHSA